MKVKVTIEGITPLLMCKFSEIQLDSRNVKNLSKEEEAEMFAYRSSNKQLMFPGINIFSAMIEAGKFHKYGKVKVTTAKSSILPAFVSLLDEECSLGTEKYEIDSRSVVVPATGGRIMRNRPRLDSWDLSFTLLINTKEFSEKVVKLIVADAGSKCGLGAYRPSKKGWFGRFEIKEWEIVK